MPESVLAQAHAWIATGAAAVAAALVAVGLGASVVPVRPGRARRWLDRTILLLLGLVGAAAVLGPIVLLVAGPPADWLHLVYAAIALAAAPSARLVAGQRGSPRPGLWVATGSLLTLGALLRLWVTGG